ncbi:hypothetical protein LCGC14_2796180 [marine sediment metagenome]|uniref:Uncharacterized protein n=1 Tax=marine sediment metagenome TaxID=412755 RepID=A0A0F9AXR0_9ZZZZ|nr:MAG: hypothetical protein Lokiarch_19090 [Candidatus Lokiarchaeum sp. GC14_75]HEA70934.1 hypothetical protein [archaeon]
MGKGGTVLGLIGIILGAGGLVLGYLNWTGQSSNSTQNKVVGIWDSVTDNLDFIPFNSQNFWLFEFGDNKLNNTDYISISNNNTRITLLKTGWYRIHLNVLLSNIGASETYWTEVYIDGTYEFSLDRHQTSAILDSSDHYIDSSGFIFSDGTTYFEICVYTVSDDVYVYLDQFNQFKIEYLAT